MMLNGWLKNTTDMETKFNSQICTSREQRERLLQLGLKKETADCALLPLNDKVTSVLVKPSTKDIVNTIPAWSLHRLCILAATPLELDEMLGFNIYDYYDNAISHIESLIKEGHFNKEYLEK